MKKENNNPQDEPPPLLVVPFTARDCPMCGATKAFTFDPYDSSRGYCFKENKTWIRREG
jgi:hypothetical protein